MFHTWKKPKYLSRFRVKKEKEEGDHREETHLKFLIPSAVLKGVAIESVAWGDAAACNADNQSTGVILIGSQQGHIYETELLAADEFFKKEDRYFYQVRRETEREGDNRSADKFYSIPIPCPFKVFNSNVPDSPILGLRYEIFPTDLNRCVVFATTSTRMYQFVGRLGPSSDNGRFGELFGSYDYNSGVVLKKVYGIER